MAFVVVVVVVVDDEGIRTFSGTQGGLPFSEPDCHAPRRVDYSETRIQAVKRVDALTVVPFKPP